MKVYWLHLEEHTDPLTEGYIGVSVNPKIRVQAHLRGKTTSHKLLEIIAIYDKRSFITTELYSGTLEECLQKEFQLRPKANIGWNMLPGGGKHPNNIGRKLSEETKRKISQSNLGKKLGHPSPFKGMTNRYTKEQRALIGSYHKGKIISEAHKQAVRDKLLGRKSPVAAKINVYHTDNPNVIIETLYCIQEYCDKYSMGYSGARSQLRRLTLMGKKEFLKKSLYPKYFIDYANQD